jgi:hypothetical protein
MTEIELTKEEQNAINTLHRLAKRWPKSLWLFSCDGNLTVMRKTTEGVRAEKRDGYMDPDFAVDRVAIECDGGEW